MNIFETVRLVLSGAIAGSATCGMFDTDAQAAGALVGGAVVAAWLAARQQQEGGGDG